jgi:hypothetical protein
MQNNADQGCRQFILSPNCELHPDLNRNTYKLFSVTSLKKFSRSDEAAEHQRIFPLYFLHHGQHKLKNLWRPL